MSLLGDIGRAIGGLAASGLGGAIGGAIGGPGGMAVGRALGGAIGGAISGGRPPGGITGARVGGTAAMPGAGLTGGRAISLGGGGGGGGRVPGLLGMSAVPPKLPDIPLVPGFTTPAAPGCPPGYHLDKRTRSYCVRNRSMNYANGKAAKRAARRVKGTIKLLRTLEKSLPKQKTTRRSYGPRHIVGPKHTA